MDGTEWRIREVESPNIEHFTLFFSILEQNTPVEAAAKLRPWNSRMCVCTIALWFDDMTNLGMGRTVRVLGGTGSGSSADAAINILLQNILDQCKKSRTHRSVLTLYTNWCFGEFSQDWQKVLVTNPINFRQSAPRVVQLLLFWTRSPSPFVSDSEIETQSRAQAGSSTWVVFSRDYDVDGDATDRIGCSPELSESGDRINQMMEFTLDQSMRSLSFGSEPSNSDLDVYMMLDEPSQDDEYPAGPELHF